jgi:hypothetical protein
VVITINLLISFRAQRFKIISAKQAEIEQRLAGIEDQLVNIAAHLGNIVVELQNMNRMVSFILAIFSMIQYLLKTLIYSGVDKYTFFLFC